MYVSMIQSEEALRECEGCISIGLSKQQEKFKKINLSKLGS